MTAADSATTNTGEHQELRRLRDQDPELYELKLFEWDYVATLGDNSSTTSQPDLDDPDDPEIFFTIGGQDDEPATAPTLQTAIELRGGVHHRSGSPSTNICPSKGTQQYPRYQPGTRGTSRTPRQDSGTQHLAAAATGPNLGQGTSTGGKLDYLLQLAKGVPRLAARSSGSASSIQQSDSGTIRLESTNRVSAVLSRGKPRDGAPRS